MGIAPLENLFREVCDEWIRDHDGLSIRGEHGVFSYAMIVWLGIQQRLKGGSLQSTLKALVERQKAGELNFLIGRPSRKLREKDISLNTGGVSRARDRVTKETVQKLFTEATKKIQERFQTQDTSRPVYLLDGQVTTTSRSDSNIDEFGRTQHGKGELHYPRLRIVAAHKLSTGIAASVAIGSYCDSEVKLSRELFKDLPKGSLLVMDRGFHRPPFLDAAITAGVDVLVRLLDTTGKKLLKESGSDNSAVNWNTNSKTEDGRPITLKGRVVHFTSDIKGFRSTNFYIFTSDLSLSSEKVAELYRQRVQVEVYIRDLKQKLNLSFIRAKKAENVKKEILLAYLTFNLLRAIMYDTAIATNTDVQRISFTATASMCEAYAHAFLQAKQSVDELISQFRKHIVQAKLPLRKSTRSYPRVVKTSRDKYPSAAILHPVNTEIGK